MFYLNMNFWRPNIGTESSSFEPWPLEREILRKWYLFMVPFKKRAFLNWNVINGYPKSMASIDSGKRNFMKDFELYQLKLNGSATSQATGQHLKLYQTYGVERISTARHSFYKIYTIYFMKKSADPC